ncbi:ubiquitin-associated domain-containing protein 1 [Phthorimaea operculella]|nr:ubiquitin-associated domain-containing protein 1 [Phthorimaea operculella]
MLVPDSGVNSPSEILVKILSPEGQIFTSYFSEDTLIEEVKNRAIDFFYPNGESGSIRYKIVRVFDMTTLHDFLSIGQEQVESQEELLLVERRTPDAGTLWDLGAVRAPVQGTIAAVTASLPTPSNTIRQPNLQSLLSTNELSHELRKILISLIEAGARLAAGGRNYENTLAQLSAALDEPIQRVQPPVTEVITPEDLAAKIARRTADETPDSTSTDAKDEGMGNEFRRAEHLQRFLEKFKAWRVKIAEPPSPDAMSTLKDLGFSREDADKALRTTGSNVPAAASWLIGERGSSIYELVDGLPDGLILQTLLKQPQIQRGLLNTRMLIAFIAMVGQTGSATLWLNSPHGSPLLSQISRTYHSEKYCLAVNQFSEENSRAQNTRQQATSPSTSRGRR